MKPILAFLGVTVATSALIVACSAGPGANTSDGTGGAGSPSGGPGATNGAQGSGGEGGLGFPDPPDGGAGGSGSLEDGGACQAIAQEANPQLQPADIIFAIDTSGSMGEESAFVRAQMNAFSQQIIASGIDVRVIMIAEFPPPFPCIGLFCPPGICIDPPLGAGGCPTMNDTKLPTYFHLAEEVSSTDGLNVLVDTFPQWGAMLRPNASKTVVGITDDDATSPPNNNAAAFIANFTSLHPAMLTGFKMSSIYCFSDCPSAANVGKVWKDVVDQTGGIHGDLCKQDFKPIFDSLATAIVTGAKVDCQWTIPPPPMGEVLDPTKVNVVFTDGAQKKTELLHVANAAACSPQNGGWYYDDNANPTKVLACPTSCAVIQSDPAGKIDILFGCATKEAPPPT